MIKHTRSLGSSVTGGALSHPCCALELANGEVLVSEVSTQASHLKQLPHDLAVDG